MNRKQMEEMKALADEMLDYETDEKVVVQLRADRWFEGEFVSHGSGLINIRITAKHNTPEMYDVVKIGSVRGFNPSYVTKAAEFFSRLEKSHLHASNKE